MFRRRSRQEGDFQEKPPDEQLPGAGKGRPEAVLRDELGLHHLWYLELRLQEEIARASRAAGVFSVCGWRLRLLPGERLGPEHGREAVELATRTLIAEAAPHLYGERKEHVIRRVVDDAVGLGPL